MTRTCHFAVRPSQPLSREGSFRRKGATGTPERIGTMRVHHVGLRHRPRRLRTTPWRVLRPSSTPALGPDGEAPLDAWLAFSGQEPQRAPRRVPDLADLPVATPVIQ